MFTHKNWTFWSALFLLCFTTHLSAQQPSVTATLATDMVVTQESTILQLTIHNADVSGWPDTPRAAPLTLKQGNSGRSIVNGRRSLNLNYSVYSYRAGVFEIPSFKISTNKGTLQTEALTLRVFDESFLKEGVTEVAGNQLPYFSGAFLPNDTPYVGEELPVMLKLFVEQDIRIQESPLAEMETKNLAAWRFEHRDNYGFYERNGKHYRSLTYLSTVSALTEGDATLGPGSVKPTIQGRVSHRGFTRWQNFNSHFEFPKIDLKIRPLPTPIPPGFEGAVGNFKITSLPTVQSLKLGESLTVDIAVTGSGNLDKIPPPLLQGKESEWKTFEAIRQEQGTERRQASGTVKFNQVLRPLKTVSELPAYQLVFFDPLIEDYRTAVSAAYPLVITGSPGIELTEVLPLVALTPGRMKSISKIPRWLWQIIPATLTLFAFICWISRKIKSHQMADLPRKEFENDLAQLKNSAAKSRPEFFRAVGSFLDRWPHSAIKEDTQEWLKTRDEICFAPQKGEDKVLPKERNKIIKILKRCAPLTIFFFAFSPLPSEASLEDFWHAEEFQKGAEILRTEIANKPSPNAYYNLGLFEEKLERPGEALHAYYRALASDSSLDPKPVIDLATKTGALKPATRDSDDWLAYFPRTTYREVFFLGLWLIILAFALRLLIKTPSRKKTATALCLILAPLALLAGGLAWWHYPEEISYRPLIEGSVVISPQRLRNAPYQDSESFKDLPAGSLGYLTAERGDWSYLEFPKGFKGWLPKDSFKPVAEIE